MEKSKNERATSEPERESADRHATRLVENRQHHAALAAWLLVPVLRSLDLTQTEFAALRAKAIETRDIDANVSLAAIYRLAHLMVQPYVDKADLDRMCPGCVYAMTFGVKYAQVFPDVVGP